MQRLKATLLTLKKLAVISILAAAVTSAVAFTSRMAQEPAPFPPPKNEPPVITPGRTNSDPPSDAIVLFDGKDLSGWRSLKDGGGAKWQVKDGYMEVVPKTGDIATKEEFGDCQLHIEWASPAEVKGEDQERGNSGVFLMGRYEVQVLDSYNNKTYYHGQAGSIYKQHAPLVNACRKPGEWQAYDIIFKAPKFDEQGKVIERARITVLHNGVLIQNNVEIYGNTWHDRPPLYIAHGLKASLKLQDHGDLVRYRNVWIRQL
jgi:3-keto-disaccharide hydrolase